MRVTRHHPADEPLLTAEIPGLTKEDVQLEVADGVFTLRGEKQEEKEEKEENYRRSVDWFVTVNSERSCQVRAER